MQNRSQAFFASQQNQVRNQRMIEIKVCKHFRSEDINYCITAIMFNVCGKAESLDEFGVCKPGIFKERSMNLLKYLIAAVPQCMPLVALLT